MLQRPDEDVYKRQLLSIAIPTGIGMAVCFLVASAARLLGLA